MIHKVKALLFFVIYLTMSAHALASIIVDPTVDEIDISNQIELASIQRDFKLSKLEENFFRPNLKNSLATGYNNGQILVKFTINNANDLELDRILYLNSINGILNLYSTDAQLKKIQLISTSGTEIPYNLRPIKTIYGGLPIKIKAHSEQTYLLSIVSQHNINSKLFISSLDKVYRNEYQKNKFLDFYAGGIILLIIYNLFIYFFLKDSGYIYYCLYASSFLVVGLTIPGYLDQLIKPTYFTFTHYLICFSSLALYVSSFFALKFLEIDKYNSNLKKYFKYFMVVASVIFISGLTSLDSHFPKFFGIIIDIHIVLGVIFFIWAASITIKKSYIAIFYLISWSFLLVAIAIWFGMSFGLFKVNTYTLNSIPLANMAEMLTLSLALAYKIQIINREKLAALEKARDKERYQRLVRVLSHDVANSLTVINSYAKKLLRNNTELDDLVRAQIQKIYHAGENIKNILQIVREQQAFVAKNYAMKLRPVNVFESVQFSKTLHDDALQLKNINLEIKIPNDLFILADQTCFINNVINNILSNAIKFSFENSKIEVYSTTSPDFTYLCFKDYGVGIPNDLIKDIFHSESVVTTMGTNHEKGTGLGSNLIREYIEIFGGKIQVTSTTKAENSSTHGTLIKLIFSNKVD